MTITKTPTVIKKPILNVTRTPITGIVRTPIFENPVLVWDEIYDKLVNYIKFASRQVSEQYQTGAVDSAEDLFQEGQLLLYHCYELYKNKPLNEFCALFKSSLWRKLRDIGSRKAFIQVDIEEAYELGYTDSVAEDMYEEYKLKHLADMLESNPLALTILKEFINPSDRTVWEAQMDVARKSMLREQNYKVSVPSSVEIKAVYIQRAMEITKARFNEALKFVKQCVSEVYQNDDSFESLQMVS